MKLRKLLVLVLSIMLSLSYVPNVSAATAGVDVLKNGSFEKAGSWSATAGAEFSTETANIGAGAGKLHLTSDTQNAYFIQTVNAIIPGATYTLTFYVNIAAASENAYPEIKFEMMDEGGMSVQQSSFSGFTARFGKWRKFTREVVIPKNTRSMNLLLRWYGAGTVYYDDVSFTVPTRIYQKNTVAPPLPNPYNNAPELFTNGSFEEVKENGAPVGGWEAYKTWNGGFVSVSEEAVHTGKKAVKIQTDSAGNPWTMFMVKISPTTKYALSSYIKAENVVGTIRYKLEFYSENRVSTETGLGKDYDTTPMEFVNGIWAPFTVTFTAPEGAYYVAVYTRLYGTGTIYADDLTCYAISETPVLAVATDEEIYYTEWGGNVTATAKVDVKTFPEMQGGKIKASLQLENEKVAEIGTFDVKEETVSITFPLTMLEKTGGEYKISLTPCTKEGAERPVVEKSVFRYDRPTMINENKQIVIDGEVFVPIYWYHGYATETSIRQQKEYGANTIIIQNNMMDKPDEIVKQLDLCEKEGVKAIVATYYKMEAGGHPSNAEQTKTVVRKVKDHPALLGYLSADEPYGVIGDGYDVDLLNTYRVIRDIDPVHPVITNEAAVAGFETVSKRSDIISHDPYVGENPVGYSPVSFVKDRMSQVAKIADRKPTIAVLQAFDWGMHPSLYGVYFPTANEIRHMTYQALLENVCGVSYFSFIDATRDFDGNVVPFYKTNMGAGMKKFVDFEMGQAIRYFTENQFTTFANAENEQYKYYAWYDGEAIYMIILDLDASAEERPGCEISVPLISNNGKVTIGKYTAELLGGGDLPKVSGEGALNHWLLWRQAAFYKITPNTPIDAALLEAA